MRRKCMIIGIVLILAIGIISILYSSTTIGAVVARELGCAEDNLKIKSIEMVSEDNEPTIKSISAKNVEYAQLNATLYSTKIRYKKLETGIDVGNGLYTIAVTSEEENNPQILTISVTEDGRVHINSSEKTYTIVNDSKIYELAKKAYDNCK